MIERSFDQIKKKQHRFQKTIITIHLLRAHATQLQLLQNERWLLRIAASGELSLRDLSSWVEDVAECRAMITDQASAIKRLQEMKQSLER